MPEIAGGCETKDVASGYLEVIAFACDVIFFIDNLAFFLFY